MKPPLHLRKAMAEDAETLFEAIGMRDLHLRYMRQEGEALERLAQGVG